MGKNEIKKDKKIKILECAQVFTITPKNLIFSNVIEKFKTFKGLRALTQSIGLLSYTFLSLTGLDRIVVPMWSPYSTEVELLKQFDDIESHGTKVIIYNLWLNDDGIVELDFDTDPEDIRICGDIKKLTQFLLGGWLMNSTLLTGYITLFGDYHCGLIGYQVKKKPPAPQLKQDSPLVMANGKTKPVKFSPSSPVVASAKALPATGLCTKRKHSDDLVELKSVKAWTITGQCNCFRTDFGSTGPSYQYSNSVKISGSCKLDAGKQETPSTATQLRNELEEVEREYSQLMAEVKSLDLIKEENDVNM
ncbi:hypothetical protein GH714_029623 [Hevea brasiliensis]|uniref:Uncharacterized protein n=1 Tax=Hevea brasiliensis TaxID=3981 RepID=A0A6A6NBD4_HEVBR|nr:hypothetical protein GH714_029623 [Hevea brasiliensis]